MGIMNNDKVEIIYLCTSIVYDDSLEDDDLIDDDDDSDDDDDDSDESDESDDDFNEEEDNYERYYNNYTEEDAFRDATGGQCEGENWTSLGRD